MNMETLQREFDALSDALTRAEDEFKRFDPTVDKFDGVRLVAAIEEAQADLNDWLASEDGKQFAQGRKS